MKKIPFLIPGILFLCSFLKAQSQSYFQQEVNYKIEVTLNDEEHTLVGNIEIEYHNNAPDALSHIWMHLWPNAYSGINTAFCKQALREGSTRFYFAEDSEFGYLDSLDFKVDETGSNWEIDSNNPDIAKINLKTALAPGEKITIRSPFLLKIPGSFSRLGHVDQSYQLTQWFPKPAVYDHKGWHPMPYLDMGEFYSEFGNFDVKITLPDNYVVGASGVLQNEEELEFLMEKVATTKEFSENGFPVIDSFPASSSKQKTLHYIAEKVHDFAWFADKRFHVQKGEVTLASGKTVDTWTMFTNEQADWWKESIRYVNQAVEFYSESVGEYPWPQATGVQSALSAGGGMEYPMITVIGEVSSPKDLDQVLTHEVGHNWFYGILASNERDYAWMDEGINSYYEYRYMNKYYGNRVVEDMAPDFFQQKTKIDLLEGSYLFTARKNTDQAPETTSNNFVPINYGVSTYIKTGSAFQHLEAYLGRNLFDKIMQSFYQEWQFKHPYPEDLRSHFEKESGKDLSWLFDGYLKSTQKLDYALSKGSEGKLKITNKGQIQAPVAVAAVKDQKVLDLQWIEGFEGEKEIEFSNPEADSYIIDPYHITLELYRQNNQVKKGGLKKPPRFKLIPSIENPYRSEVFWLPAIAYNAYDKLMLGTTFYNRTLPSKRFEYTITPLYGFGAKELVGQADFTYNIYPKSGKIQKITLGLQGKSFHYNSLDSLTTETGFSDTDLKFRKLVPSIKIDFKNTPTSNFRHGLELRSTFLQEEVTERAFTADSMLVYVGDTWESSSFHELTYHAAQKRVLNPWQFKARIAQERLAFFGEKRNFIKADLDFQYKYTFGDGRNFKFRLYTGFFLKSDAKDFNARAKNALALTGQGFNDYKYEEWYFGRNETSGLWSQQISLRNGGFKAPFGSAFSEGTSNNFVFAINLMSDLPQDLPFNLPVKPYFDLGYFDDTGAIAEGTPFAEQLWWSLGFALDWGDGLFSIYFPVLNSKTGLSNVDDLYKQKGNYWSRISFNINFSRMNPWKVADEITGF